VASLRGDPGLPRAGHSHFQPGPKWTHHGPKLSPSAKLVAPLVKAFLRNGKKHCTVAVRKCERSNSADTKVSDKGEDGGAPGAGPEIP